MTLRLPSPLYAAVIIGVTDMELAMLWFPTLRDGKITMLGNGYLAYRVSQGSNR
jgi:hypothetical protein